MDQPKPLLTPVAQPAPIKPRPEIPMTPEEMDAWVTKGAPDLGGDPVIMPSASMERGRPDQPAHAAGVDTQFAPSQISHHYALADAMMRKAFQPAHNWGDVLASGLAGYFAGREFRRADAQNQKSSEEMKAYTAEGQANRMQQGKEQRFWHLLNAMKGKTQQQPQDDSGDDQ